MKAGVFVEPGRVEVNNEVPIPKVEGENEAVIRVLRACVCGSDLWWFRGINPRPHGSFTGHDGADLLIQTNKYHKKSNRTLILIMQPLELR